MKNIMIAALLLCASGYTAATAAAPATLKEARPGAKQYGSVEHGKEIVAMWCVGCHKTGARADDRVPSLIALAANPMRTDGAIRAFLMQPHKPMPPLELGTQQIEDIIVYLRTLAPRPSAGAVR